MLSFAFFQFHFIISLVLCLEILQPPIPYVPGVLFYTNSDFGMPYTEFPGISGSLQVASPATACVAQNASQIEGKVMLAARGLCAFSTKYMNALNAGAIGVIVYNSLDVADLRMTSADYVPPSIPCVLVSLSTGLTLSEAVLSDNDTLVRFAQAPCDASDRETLVNIYYELNGPYWSSRDWNDEVLVDDYLNNKTGDPCLGRWYGVQCFPTTGKVMRLFLSERNATGPFPPSVLNLTDLMFLDISLSVIKGPIPDDIDRLQYLNVLNLGGNQINGSFPSRVTSCVHLSSLALENNLISSVLPSDFSSLTKLKDFVMMRNNLFGVVPASLLALPSIVNIYLGSNQLSAIVIVDEHLNNVTLSHLDLSNNLITGSLIDHFANCSKLHSLLLSGNQFSGAVPLSYKELSTLVRLDISDNNLSQLDPEILYGMLELTRLDLSGNRFEGLLPIFEGACPQLQIFFGSHNQFSNFNYGLYSFSKLKVFDISYNSLNMSIHQAYTYFVQSPVRSLNFAHNHLYNNDMDFLRLQLYNCPNLVSLDISENNIEGQWELEIFRFGEPEFASPFLEKLYLHGNPLTGNVPGDISSVYPSLKTLDMRNTQVHTEGHSLPSGIVPDYKHLKPDREHHYSCPDFRDVNEYFQLDVQPEYHHHYYCICDNSYFRVYNEEQGTILCRRCIWPLDCFETSNITTRYSIASGYQATPSLQDPLIFLKCQGSASASPCLETTSEDADFQCAEGFTGRLCGDCVFNYFPTSVRCAHCSELRAQIPVLYICFLVVLLYSFRRTSRQKNLRNLLEDHRDPNDPLKRSLRQDSFVEASEFSAFMTLFIDYYQLVSQVSQHITQNIDSIPMTFNNIFFDSLNMNIAHAGWLECFHHDKIGYQHWFKFGLLTLPVTFVCVCAGSCIVYTVKQMCRPFGYFLNSREEDSKFNSWRDRTLYAFVYLIFWTYFPIASHFLSVYQCEDDPGTGVSYMNNYPTLQCNAIGTGWKVLGFSIYGALPILLAAVGLWYMDMKYARKECPEQLEDCLSFLVLPYRAKYAWVSILLMVRRLVLSITLETTMNNLPLQVALLSFIILSTGLAVYVLKPFCQKLDGKLATYTTFFLLAHYSIIVPFQDLNDRTEKETRTFQTAYFLIWAAVVVLFSQNLFVRRKRLLLNFFGTPGMKSSAVSPFRHSITTEDSTRIVYKNEFLNRRFSGESLFYRNSLSEVACLPPKSGLKECDGILPKNSDSVSNVRTTSEQLWKDVPTSNQAVYQ